MEIIAKKRFIKISPDKIRPIVNLIRGKKANFAIHQLTFLNKSAAASVKEIVKSAIASAKSKDMETEDLTIKTIFTDEGPRLKRRRVVHKGRATAINKRMSHITIILTDNKTEVKKAKKASKDTKDTKVTSGGKNGSKSKSK
jgi:large subunit ribosomal protein L22